MGRGGSVVEGAWGGGGGWNSLSFKAAHDSPLSVCRPGAVQGFWGLPLNQELLLIMAVCFGSGQMALRRVEPSASVQANTRYLCLENVDIDLV